MKGLVKRLAVQAGDEKARFGHMTNFCTQLLTSKSSCNRLLLFLSLSASKIYPRHGDDQEGGIYTSSVIELMVCMCLTWLAHPAVCH